MFRCKLLLFAIGLCVSVSAINCKYIADAAKGARPRYHVDILRLDPETDTLVHTCDGAILDRRHVLTAAHCVYGLAGANLRVRSGSDVAPPPNMPHQEERLFHRVVRIMYPMDYVQSACRQHQHDVAIVKVNRAFDLAYDQLYKQVYLPEVANDYEGYEAVVSGYSGDRLNTMESKVISNEECARNSTSIVTGGNVCGIVGEETVAANYEISGSPLVYENTVIGVLNAPIKCNSGTPVSIKCVEQSPNLKLYTRVTAYLDFVDKVLNNRPSADIVYHS